MARQTGLIRIEGTVGDMTYYKSKDGYMAKQKTVISGDRIASDPRFARTRENMAEFGNAGKAGKLLRNAIHIVLKDAKDNRVTARLVKRMMDIVKTDGANARGSRTVGNGDLSLLKGFEFNAQAALNTTLFTLYAAVADRTAGTVTVGIEGFVPTSSIVAPQGATHFKIVSAASAVDFENGTSVTGTQSSDMFEISGEATDNITLVNTLTPGTTMPLFTVLGILFFTEVNGVQYSLQNGSFNALSMIEVTL